MAITGTNIQPRVEFGLQSARPATGVEDGLLYISESLINAWDNTAGAWRTTPITASGTFTYVGGTVLAGVSVPGMTATSKVILTEQVAVPGAGSLTVQHMAVAGTDKFTPTALIAVGTINVLDLSTMQWFAIL